MYFYVYPDILSFIICNIDEAFLEAEECQNI